MMQAAEDETMQKATPITCLFVDIGGVLLTDGWGRESRKLAVAHFKLDAAEMEDRHAPAFAVLVDALRYRGSGR
jgi:putative hydrolase of the HAD superfamily